MRKILHLQKKLVNFSTFIDIVKYSKTDVSHALCNLYTMEDSKGYPNVKLLIGSLHWMRKIRNSCAHNERVYCITRQRDQRINSGRIIEKYLPMLGPHYTKSLEQKIFDLVVYFKYYLPNTEYKQFINELKSMLIYLQSQIHPHAFDHIRAQMGIRDLNDLDALLSLPKNEIDYNKFDK